MNLKILTLLCFINLVFSCSKNEEVSKRGNYVVFPDQLFGINFITLQLPDIIRLLQDRNIPFKCYDLDGVENNNIGSPVRAEVLSRIWSIKTPHFIGDNINNDEILNVEYMHNKIGDDFVVKLKIKIEYYNKLLDILNNKFGLKKAYVNVNNYNEIRWRSDPSHVPAKWFGNQSIPGKTVIADITISKRLKYDDPETAEKGVFYLVIETWPRHRITF